MKKIIIFTVLFCLVSFLKSHAQALYTGGEGGGYSSLTISSASEAERISQEKGILEVSVYPNPVSEFVPIYATSVDFTDGKVLNFQIFDLLGNSIKKQNVNLNGNKVQLDLPFDKMKKGIYLLYFKVDQKQKSVRITQL